MTKLLEHAVDSVRALPPEVQDELARLLLQVAGEEQPVILLTSEECADLAEADAEIARGEFATDEQIRSILGKAHRVRLRVTRRAATQIEKALDYIEADSPQGANQVRARIQTLFRCSRSTLTRGKRLTFQACGA